MGLYHDKQTGKIIQDDKQLDMIDPKRYFRHETIDGNKSEMCKFLDEQIKVFKRLQNYADAVGFEVLIVGLDHKDETPIMIAKYQTDKWHIEILELRLEPEYHHIKIETLSLLFIDDPELRAHMGFVRPTNRKH